MADLNEMIKRVAVIGAGGKMGSGIALLLLQEMACQEAELTGAVGAGEYFLHAIDADEKNLNSLKGYLKAQITKFAEKNINRLREWYARDKNLIDNEEIVDAFVDGTMNNVQLESSLEEAKHSTMIFEAIVEDIAIKAHVFSSLEKIVRQDAYYFTNTSSIPISVLAEKSGLKGRLIGYHFYNPPAVQKLLEIIPPSGVEYDLKDLAILLAKKLKKTPVFSRDIAGFIGNGFMIREIAFACRQLEKLSEIMPVYEAIYILNKISQDFLIRPMGTFQLLDYVGIDVAHKIAGIMTAYLPDDNFRLDIVSKMIEAKIWGGQYPNGSQKNGFFQYEDHELRGIYDLNKEIYLPLDKSEWQAKCDAWIGDLPQNHASWKRLVKDPKREEKLSLYFQHLCKDKTRGAELAKSLLLESREIAFNLVRDGVAATMKDVDIVLENGFFHLYGPDSTFLPSAEKARCIS